MFDWYSQSPNPDELYHYGRLGMKWGQHIYEHKSSRVQKDVQKYYAKNNIESADNKNIPAGINKGSKSDTINSGVDLYRISSKDKEDHNKRIYATASFEDFRKYSNDYLEGLMWTDRQDSQMYLHKLSTIKPLTVAKGQEVADYIVSKYGNDEQKRAVKFLNSIDYDAHDSDLYYYKEGSKNRKFIDAQKQVRRKFLFGSMYDKKISSDVFKEFSKRGYDAVVDPEDGLGTVYEYPIILLNPKKSVKTRIVSKL